MVYPVAVGIRFSDRLGYCAARPIARPFVCTGIEYAAMIGKIRVRLRCAGRRAGDGPAAALSRRPRPVGSIAQAGQPAKSGVRTRRYAELLPSIADRRRGPPPEAPQRCAVSAGRGRRMAGRAAFSEPSPRKPPCGDDARSRIRRNSEKRAHGECPACPRLKTNERWIATRTGDLLVRAPPDRGRSAPALRPARHRPLDGDHFAPGWTRYCNRPKSLFLAMME